MPSKTPKQRRFMAAAANNPDFAKRAGIPVSVAKEYHEADKKARGGMSRKERRQAEGYEKKPKGRGTSGDSSAWSFGAGLAGGSRKRKGWRAVNPQTKSGAERRKRRWAKRQQEEGRWGDEVLTNVKNPTRRRNLVRAGWVPVRDPERKAKGPKGREGKKYKYGLDKNTVFYPPTPVTQFTGQPVGGLARTIQYRDPRSYISGGAEGGEVEVKAFYGGPTKRLKRMLEEKRQREADPNWQPWMELGTEPLTYKQLLRKVGGGKFGGVKAIMRAKQLGWVPSESGEDVNLRNVTWYPPEQTMTAGPGPFRGEDTPDFDPGVGVSGYGGFTEGGIDPTVGQGRGRRGGRGGGRGRTPPGRTPPGPVTPPRDIPPAATPPYTPPDRRAGRDTPYSEALAAHRARIRASLAVPPSGFAEGGTVRGYQEGGTARSDNPYDPVKQKYQWRAWERKQGRDPDAPVEAPPPQEEVEAVEAEDEGILSRLFGRSGRELEEIENQAEGGAVGYQRGGMAELRRAAMTPPMGGVPPRVRMQAGGMMPRGLPAMMRRAMPPGGMRKPMVQPMTPPRRGNIGGGASMVPAAKRRPRMMVPPTMRQDGDMVGPTGGPQIPPSLRGRLQAMRMMNRPPRMVGRGVNRVGQGDQQGALARALQRGTGRPPMSRRGAFVR